VVSFTTGEQTPVPIGQETGWACKEVEIPRHTNT